jgi:hypothetical protein
MSVKYYVPVEVKVPPTTQEGVVRLADLNAAMDAKFKMPVRAAAAANLAGTYDGSAKTLTASADAALAVDTVDLDAGDRVLLYGQTDAKQNGIYVVTDPGGPSDPWVLTRAGDFDETADVYSAVKVSVSEGASSHDSTFILVTDDPITLDTTDLLWTLSTGNVPQVVQRRHLITGTGSQTSFTFTHNLDTLDVTVDLVAQATGETVYADVARTANAVTVSFSPAAPPASGEEFAVLIRAVV